LEGEGEENMAVLIRRCIERVGRGRGVRESFEECGGGEAVVPLGMLGELVGGESAGGVVSRKDEGAE
jgi:hypothetical protein